MLERGSLLGKAVQDEIAQKGTFRVADTLSTFQITSTPSATIGTAVPAFQISYIIHHI